jgi:hypothetical protein
MGNQDMDATCEIRPRNTTLETTVYMEGTGDGSGNKPSVAIRAGARQTVTEGGRCALLIPGSPPSAHLARPLDSGVWTPSALTFGYAVHCEPSHRNERW